MQLVGTIKPLIQKLRDDLWKNSLKIVTLFCEQHEIYITDFNVSYIAREGCARYKKDHITFKHHYRVKTFYPIDFNEQENITLRCQLQHFLLDVTSHLYLKNLSTIYELSATLTKSGKMNAYYSLSIHAS
ncbi:hypothetical protein Lal_00033112 [Lupinus albus]|nr:hypothetical protein Lal_00033112 [Lupinus albus]